jgi:membrane protein implicated in regulation of membrane protease activity
MERESSTLDLRLVAVVLAAVVVLLYSFLIVQQLQLGIIVIVWGFLAYLAWRFVRAFERIAAAQEKRAAAEGLQEAARDPHRD